MVDWQCGCGCWGNPGWWGFCWVAQFAGMVFVAACLWSLSLNLTLTAGEAAQWGRPGDRRDRPMPRIEGRVGAAFVIYHGEVSEDSDGPIEWCRPVPDGQAEEMAARFPQLTLRTEPAHQEAYVHLGDTQANPPQWQLVSETLYAWAAEQHRQ